MGEFFTMGGHALFVWSSYAIGVGSLVALAVVSRWSLRTREAELRRLQQAMLENQRSIARTYEREEILCDP